MSKDFANRKKTAGSRATPSRGKSPRATTSRARPAQQRTPRRRGKSRTRTPAFHGPSFSGGIVLGAIGVLVGLYLPDLFEDQIQQTLAAKTSKASEAVQFEFDQRLRDSEVRADPNTYADDANPGANDNAEYLIQAASFQTMNDAESLRAQLILIDLPVRTTAVQVGDKPWFRVTVGPFLSQVEAGRAMTRLRELNLDAFLIKRQL